MPDILFAIPGDIDSPTGGYGYDRRLLAGLSALGLPVRHLALPASFPFATVPDLARTGYLLGQTSPDDVLLVDGLAYGALTDLVLKDLDRRFVALVHHPLALETGLNDRQRRALVHSERSALARAKHVIVTSPLTARLLVADYGVSPEAITVALPGTDPAPRTRPATGGDPVLLAVGSVTARKAYPVLAEALSGLKDIPWTLRIIGTRERGGEEAGKLDAALEHHGLTDRVTVEGAQAADVVAAAYGSADIFVMPSLFEGYGMVLAEAMARGLPIVCTTGGAAAETVPDAAGLKVPPGDAGALREALRRILRDSALRARLADASWSAGQQLPRWSDTAATVAAVLRKAMP